MKIILGAIKEFNDDALLMAKQLGSEGFHFNTPPIATNDEDFWTVRALKWLKEYTEKFQLKLEMIENVPIRFFQSIMLGSADRDQKIENYIKTVKNMGEVGIPILGHHFCPTWAWRTSISEPTRGGAKASAYNAKLAQSGVNAYAVSAQHMAKFTDGEKVPTAKDLWANYEYFIKAVAPEAEKAGVKLIIHPSDPPVKNLAGVDRIFICKEDFVKAEQARIEAELDAQKDAEFAKYEVILADDANFSALKERKSEMTVKEIESECAILYTRKSLAQTNFSKSNEGVMTAGIVNDTAKEGFVETKYGYIPVR